MTVQELIKELKKYPSNAVIVRAVDWENPDDDGYIKTVEVNELGTQTIYDNQFDGDDEVQVMF